MSRLSVLIPAYRPGPYLREAVVSVLAQEGVDLDLLVVDDASPEPVAADLASIDDPRLRIVHNPVNLGLVGNWNRCLDLAKGDPILLFHQDDRLLPGYLARARTLLDSHPSVGFVFCNIAVIDATGSRAGGHWSPQALPHTDARLSGVELTERLLAYGNFIPCQTVVVRAAAYRDAGHFNADLAYTPDLEMWLRLALHWGAAYLAEPMVELRRHPQQESHRFLGSGSEIDEVRHAFLCYFRAVAATGRAAPDANRHLARRHLQAWSRESLRAALRAGEWRRSWGLALAMAKSHVAPLLGLPC